MHLNALACPPSLHILSLSLHASHTLECSDIPHTPLHTMPCPHMHSHALARPLHAFTQPCTPAHTLTCPGMPSSHASPPLACPCTFSCTHIPSCLPHMASLPQMSSYFAIPCTPHTPLHALASLPQNHILTPAYTVSHAHMPFHTLTGPHMHLHILTHSHTALHLLAPLTCPHMPSPDLHTIALSCMPSQLLLDLTCTHSHALTTLACLHMLLQAVTGPRILLHSLMSLHVLTCPCTSLHILSHVLTHSLMPLPTFMTIVHGLVCPSCAYSLMPLHALACPRHTLAYSHTSVHALPCLCMPSDALACSTQYAHTYPLPCPCMLLQPSHASAQPHTHLHILVCSRMSSRILE